ncbi:hypothetical protein [Kineosporia sp. NBRC 101731]|uniref:hypothetical protein n=1 Tax=Kineosporia sp. NBRC 101731 TaxID=3032199 RepID=UPI0024A398CB|nr:hypothetical protein [Kineosporia sp. NBRC 101731]GLY28334.1 hypothetical protein Kisp02_16990 [Kineosporia sp. NBRC 101731]
MRVLVLDGHGALGRATATALAQMGDTAVLAGRDPGRYEQMLNLRGDLKDFYHAASQAAVVVNASGREDPRLVARATSAGAAFVELGGSPAYLSELADPAGTHPKTPVLTAARLVPVLAGMLARDVAAQDQGRDPVEIGVVLGAGDPESAADIGSTYALLGRYFTDPATGEEVLNFSGRHTVTLPDGTRRSLARVDFPDQQMLTAGLGRPVRTYLATSDRFTTALLQGLTRLRGASRLPSALHLPGNRTWHVVARAGQNVSQATAHGQLPYAAHIAALAVRRAPTAEPGLRRVHDLLTLSDLGGLEGLTIVRSRPGVSRS